MHAMSVTSCNVFAPPLKLPPHLLWKHCSIELLYLVRQPATYTVACTVGLITCFGHQFSISPISVLSTVNIPTVWQLWQGANTTSVPSNAVGAEAAT